ncbi:MAG: 3-keto-5-aminohexanoate cleavage protein [Microbacterium sp.]|uniref:3-keto-5-aminohexanoate cleavage protein n=1 Tax=Microbacterium sp. TaxID=51671 RepID=UPI001D8604EB|nr:3-keto-5-aminohexanoate cleavage protein [Microbacterium sp.]MBW8762471.1 3-keto-5-aminohexanoate cleavage protein [Microbacterium sp.]
MLLQACINGARDASQHPWLSADEALSADDAARAVAAGAQEIHVHPKDAAGRDSLAADDVARWVRAIRAACPGVPVGVTTGAWAEPDSERRTAAIAGWTVLPDYASVNWHEAGADEVAAALIDRGVGVEAGIWDGPGLEAWRRSPVRADCLRVLVELPDEAVETMRGHAEGLIAHIAREEPMLPILLHGEDRSAWAAFDLAVERGLDSRVGLEDTLTLPDGRPASDNASLVRAALARRKTLIDARS